MRAVSLRRLPSARRSARPRRLASARRPIIEQVERLRGHRGHCRGCRSPCVCSAKGRTPPGRASATRPRKQRQVNAERLPIGVRICSPSVLGLGAVVAQSRPSAVLCAGEGLGPRVASRLTAARHEQAITQLLRASSRRGLCRQIEACWPGRPLHVNLRAGLGTQAGKPACAGAMARTSFLIDQPSRRKLVCQVVEQFGVRRAGRTGGAEVVHAGYDPARLRTGVARRGCRPPAAVNGLLGAGRASSASSSRPLLGRVDLRSGPGHVQATVRKPRGMVGPEFLGLASDPQCGVAHGLSIAHPVPGQAPRGRVSRGCAIARPATSRT